MRCSHGPDAQDSDPWFTRWRESTNGQSCMRREIYGFLVDLWPRPTEPQSVFMFSGCQRIRCAVRRRRGTCMHCSPPAAETGAMSPCWRTQARSNDVKAVSSKQCGCGMRAQYVDGNVAASLLLVVVKAERIACSRHSKRARRQTLNVDPARLTPLPKPDHRLSSP